MFRRAGRRANPVIVMNRGFDVVRRTESVLLTLAGLAHIVYLATFVDYAATETTLLIGAAIFGLAYAFLGFLLWRNVDFAFPVALAVNALGLISVIMMYEQSPLRQIDPFLIAVDCVSVPMLIYLNAMRWREKAGDRSPRRLP